MKTRRRAADRPESEEAQWGLRVAQPGSDTILVALSGSWRLSEKLPSPAEVWPQIEATPGVRRMVFDTQGITGWDSGLLTFLGKIVAENDRRRIDTDRSGLPEGVRRLLALASAVPERKDARQEGVAPSMLARLGIETLSAADKFRAVLAFLGEVCLGALKLLRGTARYRRVDLLISLQECGAQALPIVTLISFLVGVILAYVGAVQLRQFGAQIYVADLVGIAMVRQMGAMMAAVIMAGRTGAAFAASLGTMQVNEEIDALTTLGISPMEFLVLPRVLALTAMMPLLCVYADLVGILGGACVGVGMLDLGGVEYFVRSSHAITLRDVLAGLVMSGVFGALVALAGCLRGMQCGRSSAAVGWAATSAVVTGIVLIVVADALMTVIFNIVGF
jgi:phospholipid/cholesterol/gamma-HCH transport system permease protein